MFDTRITGALCLVVITALTTPLDRDKRQSENEGNVGTYSFEDLCSLKLDVNVSDISQAVTNGIPSPEYCEDFVLQCLTTDGNVTTYVEQCGVGLWWSFKSNSCQIPDMAERYFCAAAICPSYGTASVADKRACYGHYECLDGIPFYEFCEEGGFNPSASVCELPTDCKVLTPQTGVNGSSCSESDLPQVCSTPGYLPSLSFCGCIHQDWEL